MNCPDCERELYSNSCVCGYRVPTYAQAAAPHKEPPGITLEQFGIDLFQAIRAIGALFQARRMLQGARNDVIIFPTERRYNMETNELETREKTLIAETVDSLSSLSASEQMEVLRRYPEVKRA